MAQGPRAHGPGPMGPGHMGPARAQSPARALGRGPPPPTLLPRPRATWRITADATVKTDVIRLLNQVITCPTQFTSGVTGIPKTYKCRLKYRLIQLRKRTYIGTYNKWPHKL